jgi:hypothetical protein
MDVTSSLAEYFRDRVGRALRNQGVATDPLTEFYLVNLLAEFSRARLGDEPLAIKMCEGMQATPGERAHKLREIGDTSLFVSGCFPDSLNRSLIDVDYYINMGEVAYGYLGRMTRVGDQGSLASVWSELSSKFSRYVEVLGEVANDGTATSSACVLRLYEKYVRTGNEAVLAKLERHGFMVKKGLAH